MQYSTSQQDPPENSVVSEVGKWILLVAIGLVPLVFLPGFQSGFEVPRRALVLVVIGPLAAFLVMRDSWTRGLSRVPLLALLLILAAGLWPRSGGFDVHQSWRSLRHVGVWLAFLLAGTALFDHRDRKRLVLAIVLPAIPVLAIGLLRRHAGLPAFLPDRADVWIASTIGNSNELGEAFAPVFLAGLATSGTMWTPVTAWLTRIGTACALALVVLSHSRGAWLATACGVGVLAGRWLWKRRDDREVRFRATVIGLVLVIVFFTWVGLPAGAGLRATLASYVSTTHPTNVVRLETWAATTGLIRETMPFGSGFGTFEARFLPHRRAVEWDLSGADTRVDSPHQEVLWIAAETGVVGLLGLALLLVIAFARATRPDEQSDDDGAVDTRPALLAATVGFVVLAFFRSPLHHPSGALTVFLLLGANLSRLQKRFPVLYVYLLALPVVGACAVMSAIEAREDWELGRAIGALNAGKAAGAEGRRDAVVAELTDAGRRLKATRQALLVDFDRTFRASLAASELADLKDALRAAAPGESYPDLPERQDVSTLLEETLRRCPNHPGATNQLALLWLKQGSVARAIEILKKAVAALPNAPLFRQNLAAIYADRDQFADAYGWFEQEIARKRDPTVTDQVRLGVLSLGLGRDAATFGRYLSAAPTSGLSEPIAPDAAPAERRQTLLRHLVTHPDDRMALADLAQVDFKLAALPGAAPDLASEGNRAYARSRVRFALDAIDSDDIPQAEIFLRQASQKDPALLDIHFVRAMLAARADQIGVVVENLRTLRDRGVTAKSLNVWISRDPPLANLQSAGRLSALGL